MGVRVGVERIPDEEIVRAVADSSGPAKVVSVRRRASRYASSSKLENIEVILDDGRRHSLVLKDLRWSAMLPDARAVRPSLVYDERREPYVYANCLDGSGLAVANVYRAVADEDAGAYWVLLERLAATPLWQRGRFGPWLAVAGELADLHLGLETYLDDEGPLLHHGPELHRTWLRRARRFAGSDVPWRRLAGSFDRAIETVEAMPKTILHGDFHPSNVLVARAGDGTSATWVIDWELAGPGPAVLDVAALTSGRWTGAQRRAMALSYYERTQAMGAFGPGRESFLHAVEAARLLLSIQWLGWTENWSPPGSHAYDWAAEAVQSMAALGYQ